MRIFRLHIFFKEIQASYGDVTKRIPKVITQKLIHIGIIWRIYQEIQSLASSKGELCDIIGTTHLHTKFNIFRTKDCCPLSNTLGKGQLFSYIFLFYRVTMPLPWAFARRWAYFQWKFRIPWWDRWWGRASPRRWACRPEWSDFLTVVWSIKDNNFLQKIKKSKPHQKNKKAKCWKNLL